MSGKPGQENSLGNPAWSVNGQRRAIREIQSENDTNTKLQIGNL